MKLKLSRRVKITLAIAMISTYYILVNTKKGIIAVNITTMLFSVQAWVKMGYQQDIKKYGVSDVTTLLEWVL